MGFLSQDVAAQVSEALESVVTNPPETPAPAAVAEEAVDSSNPAEDVKVEADSGAEAASEEPSTDDGDVESGHRVPYNRFKSVLEARNEFRDKTDNLSGENERLRAQIEDIQGRLRAPAAPAAAPRAESASSGADSSWVDRLLSGEDLSEVTAPTQAEVASPDSTYQVLESRVRNMELQDARRQLDIEVTEAMGKYPGVDEAALYQAIAQNPGQPALQLAERFHTWQTGVEEAAIARYLEDHKGEEAPAAAPRPSSSGVSASSPVFAEGEKPKTLAEAREALRDYLSKNNPFAT